MKFPGGGLTRDILAGSVATLALFLAYVTVPLIGMLGGLFAPLPGAFYYLKSGKTAGMAITLITASVLAVAAGPSAAALYLLECATIALALPFFLEREVGGARAVVSTVAVTTVAIFAAGVVYGIVQGADVHRLVQKGIEVSIAQTALLYEKSGVKGDELEAFKQAMQQAGTLIGRIYPAMAILAFAGMTTVILSALMKLAPRLPAPLPVGEFREFRNPDHLIWVVIFAGFALFIDNGLVTSMALNVLIVTLAFYFTQGMAIVTFFFNRLATPGILRGLFYLFLALQPYLTVAVAALGIFDLWGNFRTPKISKNL